jgi:hypothetical protein
MLIYSLLILEKGVLNLLCSVLYKKYLPKFIIQISLLESFGKLYIFKCGNSFLDLTQLKYWHLLPAIFICEFVNNTQSYKWYKCKTHDVQNIENQTTI